MNKKKVLFVIPYMHQGGAQRALSNLQSHMPDSIEITTLVNSEIGRVYPNYGKVISLHIDGEAQTASLMFQFTALIKRVLRLKKLRRSGEYCACISFIDSANIANIISLIPKTGKSIRTIISIRTSISENAVKQPQYRFFVKPLAKLLYRKADCVVSVSEELRNELIKDYGLKSEKVLAITNGFDREELIRLSRDNIAPEVKNRIGNKKVIFTAGRLNIAKSQWHLIRAFSFVKAEIPDSVLIIAGTGELEKYLRNVAECLGISENVIFLGFEKNVYRYMSRSDVFVLPSSFEGFPNSLGEAMCIGIPCIATDFRTGSRELLAPELLLNDRAINEHTQCEYGIISPNCSGVMYKGNEQLEKAEMELAYSIIDVLENREINERYRKKSTERSQSLDIQSAVRKWVSVIEG